MIVNSELAKRYIVGVLVNNEPGVLARVSGLFSRRGFNIDSLAVGPTMDESISRITIVVRGDKVNIEQLVQQLYKLISVQKVKVFTDQDTVARQLMLVKVRATHRERESLMRLADIFKSKVVDVTKNTVSLQLTGDTGKIESIMSLLEDYGIVEIVRTGMVALERGDSVMTPDIFD
jgi:acetolactate synthase-1/3 small subunit